MAQTRAERLAEMETKTPVPERVWALRNVAGEMETKTPVPELVWALCDVVGEMETKTLVPEHVWVLQACSRAVCRHARNGRPRRAQPRPAASGAGRAAQAGILGVPGAPK